MDPYAIELHMAKAHDALIVDLNELQVNLELKWIKCMRDDENIKEITLASI